MKRTALLPLFWVASLPALAHEGHGLPGSAHWHATDVVGYLLLALAGGIALWWWNGRK